MGAGLFLAWVPCIDIIKGVFSQWTYLPEVAQAHNPLAINGDDESVASI